MAATYDEELPDDRDKVRVIIGDTDVSDALMSDEHIDAVLGLEGGVAAASVFLLDELIARYSHDPMKVERGGLVMDFTKRLEWWAKMRERQQAIVDSDAGTSAWSSIPRTLANTVARDEYSNT